MTDYNLARVNMVESQVRPNGITDSRIIAAMAGIAREKFVPVERRSTAYMDEDIPLAKGARPRFLIEAMAFARLVQLAAIKPTDKVLHVGAATGYGSEVLAGLSASVVALESDAVLAALARRNLSHVPNVSVVEGSFAAGASSGAPYDVVFLEGRIGEMPVSLIGQLADGGRAVAVVGEADVAKACIWTMTGKNCSCRTAFDATVALLPGLGAIEREFVF